MLAYFIATGVIGIVLMGIGTFYMTENWQYGFNDDDVIFGAWMFFAGAFAAISLPIALIVGPCYGIYKAWTVINYNIKKGKDKI